MSDEPLVFAHVTLDLAKSREFLLSTHPPEADYDLVCVAEAHLDGRTLIHGPTERALRLDSLLSYCARLVGPVRSISVYVPSVTAHHYMMGGRGVRPDQAEA